MTPENKPSDDLVVLSIAFVAFCMIAGLIGFYQGIEMGQSGSAEIQAQKHHENTSEQIGRTCVDADPIAFGVCVEEAIKTSGEYQRAERDLAAQQSMAAYAKGLLWLTLFTSVVTAFGVWFVKRTLDQGADINRAAVDAAKAANNTNQIMRHEQRPWVVLEREIGCKFSGEKASVSLEWGRSILLWGRTPAFSVRTKSQIVSTTDYSFLDLWDQFIEGVVMDAESFPTTTSMFPNEKTEEIRQTKIQAVEKTNIFLLFFGISHRLWDAIDAELGLDFRVFEIEKINSAHSVAGETYVLTEHRYCRQTT